MITITPQLSDDFIRLIQIKSEEFGNIPCCLNDSDSTTYNRIAQRIPGCPIVNPWERDSIPSEFVSLIIMNGIEGDNEEYDFVSTLALILDVEFV